jgi:DNA adenine methylase
MNNGYKFLRYPGSKRRMIDFLVEHLPERNQIKGRYIEPFVGSGAIYFSLNPFKAILSDINVDLIDLFNGVKLHPTKVWEIYRNFGNTKDDYSQIRGKVNKESLPERAARVLYLNRTCFKGMWRTNLKGEFNVGYGGQDRRWVINEGNLLQVSWALKKARILCKDFEEVIHSLNSGDFIFADPPYRPGEKEQTNEHYYGKTFRYADQIRLANNLKWATKQKINFALTNSSHPEILSLYKGYYRLEFLKGTGRRPGLPASNPGEALITNYKIAGGSKIV